ncbi:lipoate--protein ligase family protein [Limnochorda pilosa]|uniref:BPL/LPL catalytic domain-containing protein n=1 Tax=Limnochorda pilosa TaxID=1555112 RepID=A0A0K2SIU0_LIMPI|nr:lipoate--protein ligase family protein [Limnochorda pilosa]BAS26942.1 hypothetical protein LIP_1085 [Limnochorda pilosa]
MVRTATPEPAPQWTAWIDGSSGAPEEKLALEEALLQRVAAGRLGAVARVWLNGPSLVLGRFEARRLQRRGGLPADFQGAPVLVRASGGSAVPHGPDELNVTLCYPVPHVPAAPEPGYRLLLKGLQQALRRAYGVEAGEGAVPGSFCDGRFNLVVEGRKLAGTAQAQRRGAVLVHATLMVSGRGVDRLRQVAAFYEAAGDPGSWNPESVASVSEVLGRAVTPQDLMVPVLDALIGGETGVAAGAARLGGEL